MKCPLCRSEKVTKHGFVWRAKEKVQRYRCQECSKTFALEILQDQVKTILEKLVVAGLLEKLPGADDCYRKTPEWSREKAEALDTRHVCCDKPVTKL